MYGNTSLEIDSCPCLLISRALCGGDTFCLISKARQPCHPIGIWSLDLLVRRLACVSIPYMQLKVTLKPTRCGQAYLKYVSDISRFTADGLMSAMQYQYGYIPHTACPPVDHTVIQTPAMPPVNITACETSDERHSYPGFQPGQIAVYANGSEAEHGQCLSPTVEVNVEELLEYQRRRSSASGEEKEPLTPAQRRRKAQNRAAYVSELSHKLSCLLTLYNGLKSTSVSRS